jgi:hypothetical protein
MGRLGLAGLAVTIVLNLVALLFFKKASADYFSEGWWSAWFPCYTIWLAFTIFGFARYCRQKPVDTKADA